MFALDISGTSFKSPFAAKKSDFRKQTDSSWEIYETFASIFVPCTFLTNFADVLSIIVLSTLVRVDR